MIGRKKKTVLMIVALGLGLSTGLFRLLHPKRIEPVSTSQLDVTSPPQPDGGIRPHSRSTSAKKKKTHVARTPEEPKKEAPTAKLPVPSAKSRPLSVDGFSAGMTMAQARKLLNLQKVKGYETEFSDLFVYDPAPESEVKLQFACDEKGYVLGRIDSSTTFTSDQAGAEAAKLRDKLSAEFGTSSAEGSSSGLYACRGKCGQETQGLKLTAVTGPRVGNKRTITLTLVNDELFRQCAETRVRKINAWLNGWIDAVQKFNPGMSLAEVSALYRRRYRGELMLNREQTIVSGIAVKSSVVDQSDFFPSLDYDSLAFQGTGPGSIILEFTGDQAESRLNDRLYYVYFSTTQFSSKKEYPDIKEKLQHLITAYGTPSYISEQSGNISASWNNGTVHRSVEIEDSGLITFEQSDNSLKQAYQNAAAGKIGRYNKNK